MAQTIHQSAQLYSPAYNEIIYVISSDNTGQSNFRYVADIYISGVSGFFRLKKSPHPTLSNAVFDAHRILENYVTFDLETTSYGFKSNPNSWRKYQVKFGEEYGVSSGIVVYPNEVSASSGYVFNSSLGFVGFKDFTHSNYLLQGSGSKFLTNAPLSQNIFEDENAWLYMMEGSSGNVGSARVRTYNTAGGIIATYNFTNPNPDSTADENEKFRRFGCGTRNLNLIDTALMNGASQPIIAAGVASYDITIRTTAAGGAVRSEIRTYVVKEDCGRYKKYRLHFLNELGGFDSFSFNMIGREFIDSTRTEFKKTVGTTTATAFSYSKSDKENIELSTIYGERLALESDWVTEDEAAWLEELFHSPVVYLDDDTHGLLAVNVTKTSTERKTHANDKPINIQMELKFAFNNSRQRG